MESATEAAGSAAAGSAAAAAVAELAASELSDRWEYHLSVPLPAAPALPGTGLSLVDLILTPEVFAHARADLADLRLFDAAGKPVPYAFRVLQARSERERVPAEEFNRHTTANGTLELSLELKLEDVQHDEIEIVTDGGEFRRSVVVQGSDDGKDWQPLATGDLVRFTRGEQKVDGQSIFYRPSRYRYVRVQVSPDPVVRKASSVAEPTDPEKDEFEVREVSVRHRVEVPGENLTVEGKLGPREPVRTYLGPGSAWVIDLGGERVPCSELQVDIAESEFARDVELEAEITTDALGTTRFEPVPVSSETLWQRMPGDPKLPMIVRFGEVQTRRLRLRLTDNRNPPLTIRSVKCLAAARQVVFPRPSSADSTLRLFVGNPVAEPPVYDFARNLPTPLQPTATRTSLGAAERNPAFMPAPLPFTERFPWLIYVVLGAVSLVLAAVIVSLAKASLALHDRSIA